MTEPTVYSSGPEDDRARYRVTAADLQGGVTGGEGVVYRATRRDTGEVCALKLLTGVTPEDYETFAGRSRALSTVQHPNLMRQLDTFLGCPLSAEGDPPVDAFDVAYSVSDWIDGASLTDAVRDADADRKLRWIADVAAALDHLHRQRSDSAPGGIVHRDVKPSNVRVRPDGSAVLIDFGVARPVEASDMTLGVGTYLWRAPEVLAGDPGAAGPLVDVWGLGALAHWLFVGDPPALDGAGAARERLTAVLARTPRQDTSKTPGPGPEVLAAHLGKLLESNPGDRPQDLAEWTRQLRDGPPRHSTRARRRLVAWGTTLALAGAVAATVGAIAGRDDTPSQISCEGRALVTIHADPPIPLPPASLSMTRYTGSVTLARSSAPIACEPSGSQSIRLVQLDVPRFDLVRDGSIVFGSGSGKATFTWADGATSETDFTMDTRDDTRTADLRNLKVTAGRWTGSTGAAELKDLQPSEPGTTTAESVDMWLEDLRLTAP